QLLRSNDLIWSRWLHDYLMGERREAFDLMAWNADATNMPARMHSEYLRRIFFENQLAEGSFIVDGRPVALSDIRAPVFSVATEQDHIAPWNSVYKFRIFADTTLTFLLTNGGHNAGIISEPGHRNRAYRVTTSGPEDIYVDPQSWFDQTPVHEGSWWPEWVRWLKERSGDPIPPTVPDKNLPNAPGSYVFG
ncbi:MAG TPA: poly-beta-hydroxybutyrate polymerase, partial [Hyphomicrobiales bacterium]|nr:poly-beta-hydroxybutyrate polymerase [Hyphomicrobiales bacterium]